MVTSSSDSNSSDSGDSSDSWGSHDASRYKSPMSWAEAARRVGLNCPKTVRCTNCESLCPRVGSYCWSCGSALPSSGVRKRRNVGSSRACNDASHHGRPSSRRRIDSSACTLSAGSTTTKIALRQHLLPLLRKHHPTWDQCRMDQFIDELWSEHASDVNSDRLQRRLKQLTVELEDVPPPRSRITRSRAIAAQGNTPELLSTPTPPVVPQSQESDVAVPEDSGMLLHRVPFYSPNSSISTNMHSTTPSTIHEGSHFPAQARMPQEAGVADSAARLYHVDT